jgi:hypothetical protein
MLSCVDMILLLLLQLMATGCSENARMFMAIAEQRRRPPFLFGIFSVNSLMEKKEGGGKNVNLNYSVGY